MIEHVLDILTIAGQLQAIPIFFVHQKSIPSIAFTPPAIKREYPAV
jgi:hypothetical protein